MEFGIGTSLKSITLAHFTPQKACDAEKPGNAVRLVSDDEIEQHQNEQELARANAGKRQSSDMDDFYLKFTERRDSGVSDNPVKLAKIIKDTKDQQVITTNSDAALAEQRRLSQRFGIDASCLCTLNIESKGDACLTDTEIEALKASYDVHALPEEKGLGLLSLLTNMNVLAYDDLKRSYATSIDPYVGIDYYEAHTDMAADLEQLAQLLGDGNAIFLGSIPMNTNQIREVANSHRAIARVLRQLSERDLGPG